ncbi:MAG: hypothetical protein IKR34_01520 [Candidatus Gastranaerophilales bacterium]|nr:hypothetical protein [Candidatus Gastranaerophilales bacterium]
MGLSASQGRLLLLTARQNDLEYQAQQVSQQRLALAGKLDEISQEYETSTNNRQMIITMQTSEGTSVTSNLTYAKLVSGAVGLDGGLKQSAGINTTDYSNSQAFRLSDGSSIVVSDKSEIPDIDKAKEIGDNKYSVNGKTYVVDEKLNDNGSNVNYLQNCLRNGKYIIEKHYADSVSQDKPWKEISWDSASNVADQYYDADDAGAKAKYDRLSKQVEAQDKKLQLDLDNIETQRDAVKTEIDSVEKVINENIEKTFNAFG